MAERREPDAVSDTPWANIPDVPMRAPGRGEKAIRVERQSIEQSAVIAEQQAQIQELQTMVQQLAARNEQLEASVGTRAQEIAGVWRELVKVKNHLGLA